MTRMTRKPSRFGRKPKKLSNAYCRLSPTLTAAKMCLRSTPEIGT
jgi:hypothetical protein